MPARQWSAGRVVGVVVAGAVLLLSTILLVGGVGLAVTSAVLHGDDGMVTGEQVTWSSEGYAVRSRPMHLSDGPMMPDLPRRMLGSVSVTADGGPGHDVFVGIARARDVDRYLGPVFGSVVDGPWVGGQQATTSGDGPPARLPGALTIWAASSAGRGAQTVRWEPRTGDWTLVVMNVDGTAPVSAEVSAAAELPVVGTMAAVLLASGLLVFLASGACLVLAIPRAKTPAD